MKVAALYDIHGMIHPLEAVLAEVDEAGVDAIVIGGDVAAGPFPGETLERVRALDAHVIRGNADRESDGDWLRGLPFSVTLDDVLYVHATPRSDEEILTEASSEARFAEALEGVGNRLVVAGHTHMQFRRGKFVNAGSVGMPYEGDVAAFWAVVEDDVEFRRTPFDVERAIADIEASGWPDAGAFIAENLRTAPSRREATELFESLAERVVVGWVGRPHGLAGAFVVERASDDPERFALGARLYVEGEQAEIVESKRAGGRPVIRLDREAPRGAALEVDRASLPEPEAGSYYVTDLVGLEVEEEGGERLGRVAEVTPGVANDVLELESGVLLPLVDSCVLQVDLAAGRILVAPGFALRR